VVAGMSGGVGSISKSRGVNSSGPGAAGHIYYLSSINYGARGSSQNRSQSHRRPFHSVPERIIFNFLAEESSGLMTLPAACYSPTVW